MKQETAEGGMKCSTCGISVGAGEDWVAFSCPACMGEQIIRCSRCRKTENGYTCKKCNFQGP